MKPRSAQRWFATLSVVVIVGCSQPASQLGQQGARSTSHTTGISAVSPSPDRVSQAPKDRTTERLPDLQRLLDRRICVSFRRQSLSTVLYELHSLTGIPFACPLPLSNGTIVDLEAKDEPVRDVLKRLATGYGLSVEERPAVAAHAALESWNGRQAGWTFWKQISNQRLDELGRAIKSRRADRCDRLLELADAADPRIYRLLFWAVARGDQPMALLAARQLLRHETTLRFGSDRELLLEGLERLLKNQPQEWQLVILLASASHDPAASRLLLPLLTSKEQQIAGMAFGAIENTGDPSVIGRLWELYKKLPAQASAESDWIVRSQLPIVVARLGGPQARLSLRERMKQVKDKEHRADFAYALAVAGDPMGVTALLEMFDGATKPVPPDAERRGAVPVAGQASSGGGAGGMAAPVSWDVYLLQLLIECRDERALPAMFEAMKSPSRELRLAAANGLGKWREPRGVPVLIEALASEAKPAYLINALRRIGDPRARDPLARRLDDSRAEIRLQAAATLLQLCDERGVPTFHSLLGDKSTRRAASLYLADRGHRAGFDSLIAQLADPTAEPRRVLENIESRRISFPIEPVIAMLDDKDHNTVFAAATLLAQLRSTEAQKRLQRLLRSDPDPQRRHWAARAMGWAGDPASLEPLKHALGDKDPLVRQYAARAMIAIGDPAAIEPLLTALQDSNRDVRRYTAMIIAPLSDQRIIDRLLHLLLHDEDSFVRQAAGEALRETHNPDVIRRLAVFGQDESLSDAVRTSVRRVFGPPSNSYVFGYKADLCVVDQLTLLMKSPDATVRNAALAAVSAMQERTAQAAIDAATR